MVLMGSLRYYLGYCAAAFVAAAIWIRSGIARSGPKR